MEADRTLVNQRLAELQSAVIVTHERPDGDAVGSMLALSLCLRRLGKTVIPVIPGGIPARYASLPGADLVASDLPATPEKVIAVDCADLERCAPPILPDRRPPFINIDHHPTNTRFGEVNLVEPAAAATAEVLYDLILDGGLPINGDIATNLLAGIVTDTIGFRTDNVTSGVLRKTAALVDHGGRLQEVYERLLTQHTLAAARYWGAGLQRLQGDGRIVWTRLTLADRKLAEYPADDDADLVNFLGTVDSPSVALLFVEQPGGRVKVSWRSRAGVDVSRLAQQFGGGGHEPAAGATLEGTVEEVEAAVLRATRQSLETHPSS
ncbi:MAG TPA: bifunctional oligoribonuclease/PAP phosphatase NrnA [Anaerolineales bacterium]|nr:bifunctional oligoribonuclease/PAP phosphatase NrnA [Anaerolineales bacterium]